MERFDTKRKVPKSNDIDKITANLRLKSIINNNQFLIANFSGSEQEKDFSEGSNCQGFGRIHHFKFDRGNKWAYDPLPHHVAASKLGLELKNEERVQVFQNAACNLKCWYCYVDYKLLSCPRLNAAFKTADELFDLYMQENERPYIIDLSGGQPDIIPEWPIRMMEAIIKRGMQHQCYLWIDDNLTSYNAWKYLLQSDFDLMRSYNNFGRVGCFKGFSPESFHENTGATSEIFKRQIDIMSKWVSLGLDMYGYIILTSSNLKGINPALNKFMDDIQDKIHPSFLLRIVPLEIFKFGPTRKRMKKWMQDALTNQYEILSIWNEELASRYSNTERKRPIYSIVIN